MPIAIPNCFGIILDISLTLGKGWKILVSSSFIIDMKYQDTHFDWDICIHKKNTSVFFHIRIIMYDVSQYIAMWDPRMHHIKVYQRNNNNIVIHWYKHIKQYALYADVL